MTLTMTKTYPTSLSKCDCSQMSAFVLLYGSFKFIITFLILRMYDQFEVVIS